MLLRVLVLLALTQAAQLLQIPASATTTRVAAAAASRHGMMTMCNGDVMSDSDAEGIKKPPEPAAPPAAAADDPKAAEKAEKQALREAIAELEGKLPKARGELAAAIDSAKDSGENGYMLLAANFERFRQQARSEIDSQKGYGRVGAVRSLLPFVETFGELQAAAAAESEDEGAIHKYYGGIYKQAQQLLESWKVTSYEAVAGEPFEFSKHQTVESLESEEVPKGQVIAPVAPGYMMDSDVVRLAKCTVSTGPAAVEEPAAEGEEAAESEEAEAAAEGGAE